MNQLIMRGRLLVGLLMCQTAVENVHHLLTTTWQLFFFCGFNIVYLYSELIHKHEVCVRVLGNVSLLPTGLQRVLGKAVYVSRAHRKAILNVCFAYTARDEICTAMTAMNNGVVRGLLQPSDITESLLLRSLFTEDAPEPELLVRSSGEVRLSDFLLWQNSYSVLVFTPVLWPAFSFWHFIAGILKYQMQRSAVDAYRKQRESEIQKFQWAADEAIAIAEGLESPADIECRIKVLQQERRARQEFFLADLHGQRMAYFARLAAEEDCRAAA